MITQTDRIGEREARAFLCWIFLCCESGRTCPTPSTTRQKGRGVTFHECLIKCRSSSERAPENNPSQAPVLINNSIIFMKLLLCCVPFFHPGHHHHQHKASKLRKCHCYERNSRYTHSWKLPTFFKEQKKNKPAEDWKSNTGVYL